MNNKVQKKDWNLLIISLTGLFLFVYGLFRERDIIAISGLWVLSIIVIGTMFEDIKYNIKELTLKIKGKKK